MIDHKTRVIIHHIITDKRPARQEIYKLLKVAVNVAGIPKVLITDKYKTYSPAVKRLERTLYGKPHFFHPTVEVERHETGNKINKTPVHGRRLPVVVCQLRGTHQGSLGYDKSFVFKLKDDMLAHLTVGIREDKTVVISVKRTFQPIRSSRQTGYSKPNVASCWITKNANDRGTYHPYQK